MKTIIDNWNGYYVELIKYNNNRNYLTISPSMKRVTLKISKQYSDNESAIQFFIYHCRNIFFTEHEQLTKSLRINYDDKFIESMT